MSLILTRLNFPIFLISLFFLRLPPFYILPFQSAFFTSHSIARYLLLFLFASIWYLSYKGKRLLTVERSLLYLVLFYFLTQSLSVIDVVNIKIFLSNYKTVIFSIMLFFIALALLDSKEKIDKTIHLLLFTLIINLVVEFIIYFQPALLFSLIRLIFYPEYWRVMYLNLSRGRYFVDMYETTLIPLLFLYAFYFKKGVLNRIATIFYISVASFFALLSGFRTQLLMVLFSLFGSFIVFFKRSKMVVYFLMVVFMFLYIGYKASGLLGDNYNSLTRLIFPEQEEQNSIRGRLYMWGYSIKLAQAYPLFGVGLGNFYDFLPAVKKYPHQSLGDPKGELAQVSESHPHSIIFGTLAESGYLGLISLILLIGYFALTDLRAFLRKKPKVNLVIVSFWSLFIFALFNPPVILQYLVLFWILRALIVKLQTVPFNHKGLFYFWLDN